jgi:MFS family permease
MTQPESDAPGKRWITRTVVGIVAATFLSDFSHEMCTAVLPLYLGAIGLGPAALGMIEGLADFLVSLSKLGGGVVGHRIERKRPWTAAGYLVTTLGTSAIGLVHGLVPIVAFRMLAWVGRGFRSPLRDYILSDSVEKTHYGRAYGLERAGDMLGAVAGPLIATLLVWAGVRFQSIILWTLVPGFLAAGSMFFFVRERVDQSTPGDRPAPETGPKPRFPKVFWLFLVGVFLFGLGDFSRTFLIWLAARDLKEDGMHSGGTISVAVLLYTLHNLVSAVAAYPSGRLGDRFPKVHVLIGGYALGVMTNVVLALLGGQVGWLVAAIVSSGIYIAVEETIEKATAADFLPRSLRSLGFGILACANAVGDMASSLYVGFLLRDGRPTLAFGIAAGVVWMLAILGRLPGAQSGVGSRSGLAL